MYVRALSLQRGGAHRDYMITGARLHSCGGLTLHSPGRWQGRRYIAPSKGRTLSFQLNLLDWPAWAGQDGREGTWSGNPCSDSSVNEGYRDTDGHEGV